MTASDELTDFVAGGVDEWVSALPAYQRSSIVGLLVTNDPQEVAALWLSNSGPRDTAPFGGARAAASNFYDNILRELQKVLCDGQEYEEERKQLAAAAKGSGKLVLVGSISTLIAPHVGAAAAVIGPAVALTLGILGNAGKATACDSLADLIAARTQAKESDPEDPPPHGS